MRIYKVQNAMREDAKEKWVTFKFDRGDKKLNKSEAIQ